jgi:tetratricopeptide (TPR) repeat protein
MALALRTGNFEEAIEHLDQMGELQAEAGKNATEINLRIDENKAIVTKLLQWKQLVLAARLSEAEGDYERALKHLGEMEALSKDMGFNESTQGSLDALRYMYKLRTGTGPAQKLTGMSRRLVQSREEKEFKTNIVAYGLVPPEWITTINDKMARAAESPSTESFEALVKQMDWVIDFLSEDAKDAKHLYVQSRNMFDFTWQYIEIMEDKDLISLLLFLREKLY